jgi:hypothetical protein
MMGQGINPVELQRLAEVMEETIITSSMDLGHAQVTVGIHPDFGEIVIVNAVNGRSVIVCDEGRFVS